MIGTLAKPCQMQDKRGICRSISGWGQQTEALEEETEAGDGVEVVNSVWQTNCTFIDYMLHILH